MESNKPEGKTIDLLSALALFPNKELNGFVYYFLSAGFIKGLSVLFSTFYLTSVLSLDSNPEASDIPGPLSNSNFLELVVELSKLLVPGWLGFKLF